MSSTKLARLAKERLITQELLKELFYYEPEVGVLKWAKSNNGKIKIGDIAGCRTDKGYITVEIGGLPYPSHRLIWLYMTGKFPVNDIDHKNKIRDDNRFENLREATRSENLQNRAIPKNNSSGFKGVSWQKTNKKWGAEICVNHKKIRLGYFDCKILAYEARKRAEEKYHPFADK